MKIMSSFTYTHDVPNHVLLSFVDFEFAFLGNLNSIPFNTFTVSITISYKSKLSSVKILFCNDKIHSQRKAYHHK